MPINGIKLVLNILKKFKFWKYKFILKGNISARYNICIIYFELYKKKLKLLFYVMRRWDASVFKVWNSIAHKKCTYVEYQYIFF